MIRLPVVLSASLFGIAAAWHPPTFLTRRKAIERAVASCGVVVLTSPAAAVTPTDVPSKTVAAGASTSLDRGIAVVGNGIVGDNRMETSSASSSLDLDEQLYPDNDDDSSLSSSSESDDEDDDTSLEGI